MVGKRPILGLNLGKFFNDSLTQGRRAGDVGQSDWVRKSVWKGVRQPIFLGNWGLPSIIPSHNDGEFVKRCRTSIILCTKGSRSSAAKEPEKVQRNHAVIAANGPRFLPIPSNFPYCSFLVRR